MQSQPDDLSGSSDSGTEDTDAHKNAKKAFRKRTTRSKPFNESLRMAKQTRMRLLQIHHVSSTKKIFEVDHYGKIRLVEIAETISCNCSFSSSRDLCLHTVWVMMHILKVNENDDTLHQKSLPRGTILALFRRLKDSMPTATTTVPENQGLNVASGTQHQVLIPQVPLSRSFQMAQPSNLQALHQLQYSTAIPNNAQLSSSQLNSALGLNRPPWHNNNQFILHPINNRIKKCASCHIEFRDPLGPLFLGVVLQHKEKDIFKRGDGTQQVSTEQNRYYHCELKCLKLRHPYFNTNLVQLHPELILDEFQKESVFQKIGVAL